MPFSKISGFFRIEPDFIQTATAGKSDFSIIRQIASETWPLTYAEVISMQQIKYMLLWMFSEESLTQQLADGHQFLLAKDDQKPVGFISYQSNLENGTTTKIHKIYILPSAQGLGVGRLLINEALKGARDANNDRIILYVNRKNPAVMFYHRLGFVTLREEDNEIGEGFWMNDYVMEYKL
ncbi:MAG: ribosomal protein S18 acetylase RimI-like enzyme [Cyclobacteriaceae bacterium]|jgi:ribosomal protein S18 acetylase RimI-like enzyme